MSSSNNLQDYEVISIIGTGSFGQCFKVRNKLTRKIFVWKAIDYADFDEDKRQLLVSEIKVLKQLTHPNIVQYFNHIINKTTKSLYIIMECCEGGDLEALIRRCKTENCYVEEEFIWRVLYQLSKAIQGCHSFKNSLIILHRDIKPGNVFMDSDGNIKLGDFGLARILSTHNFAVTMVGTPFYMSPEVIKGKKYNRKSDIWSLGCLIYELCALKTPFTGKHMESLSKNITSGRFDRIPFMYSDDLQKIISFMLSVDHSYRPTIEVILHHPTVASNIVEIKSQFPQLISHKINRKISNFKSQPNFSSTRIGTDSTFDLRRELFQSTTTINKCYPIQNIRKSSSEGILDKCSTCKRHKDPTKDPNEITQDIFNEALRQRLIAIRQRESKLKQQEDNLVMREHNMRKREHQIRKTKSNKSESVKTVNVPKPLSHNNYDASTMSVEPNETIIATTTAKFDPRTIRPPKAFQRAVSFKSPLRGRENVVPSMIELARLNPSTVQDQKNAVTQPLGNDSKNSGLGSSNDLKKSSNDGKRKSIFNLLNLNHHKKSQEIKINEFVKSSVKPEPINKIVFQNIGSEENIPAKWTKENKQTAFKMLALMNAATSENELNTDRSLVNNVILKDNILRHDRKRQSMVLLKRSRDNILL